MQSLPPELFDIIISYLHDDNYSLKSCSLVCRAWVSRSRYHIFYRPVHLQLHVPNHVERFQEIFGRDTWLPSYVRSLTLIGAPRSNSNCILQSLHLFTSVEELHLLQFMNPHDWETADADQREQWFIPFRSVRRLHITSSSISFSDFLRLLRHMPLLSELSFEIVSWIPSWGKELDKLDASVCFVPQLRKLKFDTRSSAVISAFSTLIRRNHIPPVSHLTIHDISRAHVRDVGDLLRILGPSLQSLKVSSDNLLPGDITGAIDLCHNSNLTHVALEGLFASAVWNGFVSDFSDWAMDLLIQLPGRCNNMEKITLGFVLAPEDRLDGVKWPFVLNTLLHIADFCQSFETIKFRFLCHPNRLKWLEGTVCERLSPLRRFLRFKRVDF